MQGEESHASVPPAATAAAPASASQPTAPTAPREVADAELAFLSAYTGRTDVAALREHVLSVWRRAVSGPAPVYLCVWALMFLEPRGRQHPAYQQALALIRAARAAPPPLWADLGSAVGTDVRALRLDGLGQAEVVALDVPEEHYWSTGLELYQDAAHPPCAALFGDICDDDVLPPGEAGTAGVEAEAPGAEHGGSGTGGNCPAQQQRSVAELAGRVSVVSCTAVLHCLGRETVERLLRKVLVLLRPGGMLLGTTGGAATAREWSVAYQAGRARWLHSAASLQALLESLGYEGVQVEVSDSQDFRKAVSKPMMDRHIGRQPEGEWLTLVFTAFKPDSPSS